MRFTSSVLFACTSAAVAYLGYSYFYATPKSAPPSSAKRREKHARKWAHIQLRRTKVDAKLKARRKAESLARKASRSGWTAEDYAQLKRTTVLAREERRLHLEAAKLSGLRIAVDLAYSASQSERERNSLVKQLACAYGAMKKNLRVSISLHLLSADDHILAYLNKQGIDSVFDSPEIIYLSPDADTVLTDVHPQNVYVIGGIVDRSIRKHESLHSASRAQVKTARLPIPEILASQDRMCKKAPVLNVDSVIQMLMHYQEHHDWPEALAASLPKRFLA